LRMPSILAGTLFCWAFYKWLARATNPLTGFLGLLLVAFLPPVVALSAEVRQYALLLGFLAGALYFQDCALDEDSARAMLISLASLYLALSSHYSGFFFAAVLAAYAVLKFSVRQTRRSIFVTWLAGQLGALALAVFFYKTHISRLGSGDSRQVLQGWMSDFFLSRSYFEAGRDNLLLFVVGHTFGVFQFIFGQLAAGDIAGLLFLAGVVLLFRAGASDKRSQSALGIFLLLLFMLAYGLSLFHLYPYGGTRHVAFLVIPAIAGVSVAVAAIAAQRWSRGITLTLILIFFCVVFGRPRLPRMERADQSTRKMSAAIDFVNQHAAPTDFIFTDYQTDLILGHYLCSQQPISFAPAPHGFEQFQCATHRVVSADYKNAWVFSGENFLAQWQRFVQAYALHPGEEVWVVQMGWAIGLPEDLKQKFTQFRGLSYESFGQNIKMFKLIVCEPPPATKIVASLQGFEGTFNPRARITLSSGTARPSFLMTTPKLPE
jgi:hypothetical protein